MSNLSAPRRSAKDFIEEVFITLTSTTCPHKYIEPDLTSEDLAYGPLMTHLGAVRDSHGNYWLSIGDSETLFACHMDTADSGDPKKVTHQRLIEKNDTYIITAGDTILGADDKAGMTLMLWMIYNDVPGDYVFFIGEERGMVGSKLAAGDVKDGDYKRMISFDRMGYESIITHQCSTRTASDDFALALSEQMYDLGLHYEADPSGLYTDSYAFRRVIPECTNLSVGYHGQHGMTESQNISFLTDLAEAVIEVDWENLPTSRDHTAPEPDRFTYRNPKNATYINSWRNAPWSSTGEDVYSDDPIPYDNDAYNDFNDSLIRAIRNGTVVTEDFADYVYGDPEGVMDLLYYVALLAPEELIAAIGDQNVMVHSTP